MKKFLFVLLIALLIAFLMGCQQNGDSVDIIEPPIVSEISCIDVDSGGGLKISISDEETIQKLYDIIKTIRGEELGSAKGHYGCLYAVTMCTDDGEKWSIVVMDDNLYIRNNMRYDPQGDELSKLIDVIEQAYIDNRVYEGPLECIIPTTSVGIDVYISSRDAEKILAIFNEAEWTLQKPDTYGMDYIFLVQSGAEIYYDKENGKMYDRDNECYFYLSDKDKAFIDEVLQKGE